MKPALRLIVTLLLLASALVANASGREEVMIPRYDESSKKVADLRVVIFSPNKEKWRPPYKVVLFTHGGVNDVIFSRAITNPTIDMLDHQGYAPFFTELGYVFVSIFRQGYFGSTGKRMSYDERRCYRETWEKVATNSLLDLEAGLGFIQNDPRFKDGGALPLQGNKIVVSGHSEGGFHALHLGKKHEEKLGGVIAFAPGLSVCGILPDIKVAATRLEEEYWKELGQSKVRNLILYASNDQLLTKARRDWIREAYGNDSSFVILDKIWLGNPHLLYDHQSKWRDVVTEFLKKVSP